MEKEIEETIMSYNKNAKVFSKAYNIGYVEKQLKFYVRNFDARGQSPCTGKRILDIGCGPGRDANYFSEKGFDVVGIDLSSELLRIAKENCPKAEFYLKDMRKLDFEPNSFDGIWACASLLHVPHKDAYQTLKGFNSVIKKGGLMFVCVLEGKGEKMEKNSTFQEHSRFFAYYSNDSIESLIRSADFKIIKKDIEKNPRRAWINLFCRKR